MDTECDAIEVIPSEQDDDYSDDSLFNISSWGADLSFRELALMYEDDELVKPELQRNYVWTKVEASRFIESILLGLPVPSIFLAKSGSQKLIVDGYQRIMTVYDYMKGIFSGDDRVFRLTNSVRINERWRNKSFTELSMDDQRKIKSTTIHAIVFEQKEPEHDDTSLYQVFERINTSGQTLKAQEIRNCVYQGSFNRMLFELNVNEKWRKLFGKEKPDSRMYDLEYILRFYALKQESILDSSTKQISLKKTLNEYMSKHRQDDELRIAEFKEEFSSVIDFIYEHLGENAFNSYLGSAYSNRFHPAIYDAIMIATYKAMKKGEISAAVSTQKHIELLTNSEFMSAASSRTTNVENIELRINLAAKILYGVDLSES